MAVRISCTLLSTSLRIGRLWTVGLLAVNSLALAQSFDAPVTKKVVDLGPSPYYSPAQKVRNRLSCYFFPALMVEEYDQGEKGAESLAIVPVTKGTQPACTKSNDQNEKVIKYPEWSGYFKGAKGSFVFFNSDDGINGGLPFVIYDSRNGRKLFQDSAYDSSMWKKRANPSPFNRLQVWSANDQQITLRYLRVVEADCDLYMERATCWKQVTKKLELKNPQMPDCSGYEKVTGRRESAIAYPVEVSLFPEPTTKTIGGPVRCWPVD
jgi:hypothetical protein